MKNPLARAISERLRTLREAAGLSQQDVAMKGDLSLSLIAKLEQGKKADPRASTLIALAAALGVKPGRIVDDLPLLPEEPAAGAAEPGLPGENGKAKKKKGKKHKKKAKEAK
jgi:transcriptional regulator with XRE-family HTH domain